MSKKELGNLGEGLAVEYLEKAGLQIVMRNYRCPKGEIDIVAQEGEYLIFIEVKTRTTARAGCAEESINQKKIRKLKDSAAYYLLKQGFKQWPPIRLDLLAINFEGNESKVNWIKGII